MERILFSTTESIKDWIADNLTSEDLALTSGGRLARFLLDSFRRERILSGASAWLPTKVVSLNEWLMRILGELWPEYSIAGDMRRLKIWLEAVRVVRPPDPSFDGLSVAEALDDNYATLIRHLINPCTRTASHPLSRWSSDVSILFIKLMRAEGLMHPVEIPVYLAEVLTGGQIDEITSESLYLEIKTEGLLLPKEIALICLDQSSPLEKGLFTCLENVTKLFSLEISASRNDADNRGMAYASKGFDRLSSHNSLNNERISAFSFPDHIQEVEWVAERAVRLSASSPLHRIGIAVTDMETYEPLFERVFGDVIGERAGEGWSGFNITMGRPVIKSSLAQAALFPLRIILGGQLREEIFSFFQSPYYSLWSKNRYRLALLDRLWRKENIEGGLQGLLTCARGVYPDEARELEWIFGHLTYLFPDGLKLDVSEWNRRLQGMWVDLGFPVITSEEDSIILRHINECISELNMNIGKERLDLREYLNFINFYLKNKIFSISGDENAGIQIMGMIEARGLSFDHLFIVGMISGGLPQPAKTLPFLTIEERRCVQGGTVEAQFRFAERLFDDLIASSGSVLLTRPEQREGEPLVPSPFFPDSDKDETLVNLWLTQSPIWARSMWLSQTRAALCARDKSILEIITRESLSPLMGTDSDNRKTLSTSMPIRENKAVSDDGYASYPTHENDTTDSSSGYALQPPPLPDFIIPIPATIPVTALEDGIACPFRFFILHCLKITMLDSPQSGIPPLVRGIMLHRCLASFVTRMLDEGLDLKADWEKARKLLKKTAEETLSPLTGDLPWSVELKRWIDEDEDTNGLLFNWLCEEIKNHDEGYRWIAVEEKFSDLKVDETGIQISGRIDRVDHHPEHGLICWDYKTGRIPTPGDIEQLKSTQILAYIMALQKGCVKMTKVNLPTGVQTGCGFIRIDSASSIKLARMLADHEAGSSALVHWEARVRDLFGRLKRGDIRPSPLIPPARKDEGSCRDCPVQVMCSYRLLGYVR